MAFNNNASEKNPKVNSLILNKVLKCEELFLKKTPIIFISKKEIKGSFKYRKLTPLIVFILIPNSTLN